MSNFHPDSHNFRNTLEHKNDELKITRFIDDKKIAEKTVFLDKMTFLSPQVNEEELIEHVKTLKTKRGDENTFQHGKVDRLIVNESTNDHTKNDIDPNHSNQNSSNIESNPMSIEQIIGKSNLQDPMISNDPTFGDFSSSEKKFESYDELNETENQMKRYKSSQESPEDSFYDHVKDDTPFSEFIAQDNSPGERFINKEEQQYSDFNERSSDEKSHFKSEKDNNSHQNDFNNKNTAKKEGILFQTPENNERSYSVNDGIALNWLNITFYKNYSHEDLEIIKLNHEIHDMERYIKNRASDLDNRTFQVEYKKLQNTNIVHNKWTDEEHATFLEYYSAYNKKFSVIAQLMKKDPKDVILHYYRTKKIEKYNKKKSGRISDIHLKTLIDLEWTDSEKNKFNKLFKFYGKNWLSYIPNFRGKTLSDFKNFYKFTHKKRSLSESDESRESKSFGKSQECSPESKSIEDATASLSQANSVSTSTNFNSTSTPTNISTSNISTGLTASTSPNTQTHPKERQTKRGQTRRTTTKRKQPKKKSPAPRKKAPNFPTQTAENKENTQNKRDDSLIVNDWTIDERHLFAILYPYIGKKWADLSNYIATKKPNDCRAFFKSYFKNLSPQEQKLESALRHVNRETLSVPNSPKRNTSDEFFDDVGIVFKK